MKKKLIFLLALMISFLIIQSASAYPVQIGDYLDLVTYNSETSAGEFSFGIERPLGVTIDTIWTFCLEPEVTITLSGNYLVTELVDGSGNAVAGSDAWNEMAWLYWNYDQGTLATATGDDNRWSGLQYAFWDLVGEGEHVPTNNDNGASFYINWATDAVANGWSNNDRVIVAVNEGQDILAANPVPEPVTTLLLGSGILGLAVFRRKFKKS